MAATLTVQNGFLRLFQTLQGSNISMVIGSTNSASAIIRSPTELESVITSTITDPKVQRLVVYTLGELNSAVRSLEKIKEVKRVLNSPDTKIPEYFKILEENAEKSNPVFFSVNLKSVAINVPKFIARVQRYSERFCETPKVKIDQWIHSIGEFLLHEWGHIADESGAIVWKSQSAESQVEASRKRLIERFEIDRKPELIKSLEWHEGDQRADVFRRSIEFPPELRGAYLTQAYTTNLSVIRLGRMVTDKSPQHDFIGFGAWLVLFKTFENGPIHAEMQRTLDDLQPENKKLAQASERYLDARFNSLTFKLTNLRS